MPRYKAIIEYLGTNYAGWQKQPNLPTIQEQIQSAIFKFCNQQTLLVGSGRTDAGVHAYGQVAHFDLLKPHRPGLVANAINFYLINTDIVILKAEIVAPDFHAIKSATHRNYVYKIINRSAPLVMEKNRALLIKRHLDVNAMQLACKHLIGRLDFTSFRSSECSATSTYKEVSKLEITSIGERIDIHIRANSFLHHMVRNIVGTLLLIGLKKLDPDQRLNILNAKSRTKAGPTAPACGLYLSLVEFKGLVNCS
jgi:tRNA pseudouridine38-40 synthase